jgi:hypothetical protein
MLSTWQFNLLTGLGAAAVLLAATNGWLFTQNRAEQLVLNQNQQWVQQAGGHEALYRELVKALAELGVKGNDAQVLNMLAAQGLSVSVNASPAGASGTPATADTAARKGAK